MPCWETFIATAEPSLSKPIEQIFIYKGYLKNNLTILRESVNKILRDKDGIIYVDLAIAAIDGYVTCNNIIQKSINKTSENAVRLLSITQRHYSETKAIKEDINNAIKLINYAIDLIKNTSAEYNRYVSVVIHHSDLRQLDKIKKLLENRNQR
uniref:DUF5618 domain-containing protein n=1 Tax=Meloidogyne hapla TaxID=6305 RepID=A0A1I8BVU9_MELHA